MNSGSTVNQWNGTWPTVFHHAHELYVPSRSLGIDEKSYPEHLKRLNVVSTPGIGH